MVLGSREPYFRTLPTLDGSPGRAGAGAREAGLRPLKGPGHLPILANDGGGIGDLPPGSSYGSDPGEMSNSLELARVMDCFPSAVLVVDKERPLAILHAVTGHTSL